MVDKSRMTLQKLARWNPNQSHPVQDRKGSAALWEGTLQPLDHEDLKQGALYIIKIHHVSVGLFQGWNDDMCCFAVLRSENSPMRWSQARYLPGDFDAFDAFDEAGNPPVHLWTRYLRVEVPVNWFAIFEEARRKQREWATHILEQQQQHLHTSSTLPGGMMMGGNSGGYPSLMAGLHHHHHHQQQQQQQQSLLDEDYNDLGTFSAAPSQSMRSEQFSSISSLPLEPTDDPLSSSPTEQITSRPHPPSTTIVHSSDHTVATCPIGEGEGTNTDYITATTSNQHTNLSPNLTTTQIPVTPTSSASSSPTTMTDELAKLNNMTPSQKLDMELGDLSFPHDDDRFSIHSDYQPSIHLRDTSSPHNNQTWKKRSIKKMLSRSSHHNVK